MYLKRFLTLCAFSLMVYLNGCKPAYEFPEKPEPEKGNDSVVTEPRPEPIESYVVSTFAGTYTPPTQIFIETNGIAVDKNGNTFFSVASSNVIYKFTVNGVLSVYAGSGEGFADGPLSSAKFYGPGGLAIDASGNLIVVDMYNMRIRKITPDGQVSTIAGSGKHEMLDGTAAQAGFLFARHVAIDAKGNIYIADTSTIRKIADGTVSTFAGSLEMGYAEGKGTDAIFSHVGCMVFDAVGNMYVADDINHRIRKIEPDGQVSTFAGTGEKGSNNGWRQSAQFSFPNGIAIDRTGNIYVGERGNNMVRRISTDGIVGTVAGGGPVGDIQKIGNKANLGMLSCLTLDRDGNLLVGDLDHGLIRKVTMAGKVSTLVGGLPDFADGPLLQATFETPSGIAGDGKGNFFVTDFGNARIRKISSGMVSTLAGNGMRANNPGVGAAARFRRLTGITWDPKNELVVCDSGNTDVLRVSTQGLVSKLAGWYRDEKFTSVAASRSGKIFVGADDGRGFFYEINPAGNMTYIPYASSYTNPSDEVTGLVVDSNDNVIFADQKTHKIYHHRNESDGITVYAGRQVWTGNARGWVDGTSKEALFNRPSGVAMDKKGNIYVSDRGNHCIRKIDAFGKVTTIAGDGNSGHADGPGKMASFNSPWGLYLNPEGTELYVADSGNNLIRKILIKK